MLIAGAALFVSIGFALGHYTAGHEPFYYIGTPVELGAADITTTTDDVRSPHVADPLSQSSQGSITRASVEGICGARTRTGKPCRRKVKSGGYCWQHRDQSTGKKPSPSTQ